jgi:hypothetical protein
MLESHVTLRLKGCWNLQRSHAQDGDRRFHDAAEPGLDTIGSAFLKERSENSF